MFSKNNIIIIKETMLTKSDMIDYEKNSNDLYKLVTDIIQELNIKTLSKIIVNCKMSFLDKRLEEQYLQ